MAQTDSSSKQTDKNFEVVLPSMIPLHPLGIFGMGAVNNFRENPVSKTYISFGISNGNIWLPAIDTYKPTDPSTQKQMSAYSWYYRKDIYNIDTMLAKKTSFSGDGVIQEYRLNILTAIQKHHEVHVTIKAYRLSGKALLSFVSNDKTIEVFHALFNINDPYKRSLHQYDSAGIKYIDEKGKSLIVNDGDVFVPGTEFSYFYFPSMHSKYLKSNIGVYSGLNFSKYNAGIDFGLSATLLATKKLTQRSKIAVGIGANCIMKKIIPFTTGVLINNKLPLYGGELQALYSCITRQAKSMHSFGINWYYQSAFFSGNSRIKNYGDLVFVGNRNFREWALTSAHLYENFQDVRFFNSFTKWFTFTYYLTEDFKLNNAPDIQTGINLAIPICYKKHQNQ